MREIQVKVKPSARVAALERGEGDVWIARVRSPPIDGRANDELVALIARHFGCRKADVEIRSGARSRLKRVRITLPSSGRPGGAGRP